LKVKERIFKFHLLKTFLHNYLISFNKILYLTKEQGHQKGEVLIIFESGSRVRIL